MNDKIKKQIILNIPYIMIGLFLSKIVQAVRLADGDDIGSKIANISSGFAIAFQNLLPSFNPLDLVLGLCLGGLFKVIVHMKGKNAKKYRHSVEL